MGEHICWGLRSESLSSGIGSESRLEQAGLLAASRLRTHRRLSFWPSIGNSAAAFVVVGACGQSTD